MPTLKNNILGTLDPEQFLQEYWQKQPCLIRQALPGYQCPLSPEELAGLACEEGVEARLVMEKGGAHPWQVKYGPLTETEFRSLPETHWTLLVQGVEQYHNEINALLTHFNFIPNWRIDDVMISYAAKYGGVGPHLDSYDVFLLQGRGQRRWQINTGDYTEMNFIPDLELRIIDNFHPQEEWVLEPGDMLYLPPGVAHYGIALEPCMTLSIGFLAPVRSELITAFIDDTVFATARDSRFTDPDRCLQKHAGEIGKTDLDRIAGMMRSALTDDALLEEWFGRYITLGKEAHPAERKVNDGVEKFANQFQKMKTIYRRNGVRTAFVQQGQQLILFVDGKSFPLAQDCLPLVKLITEQSAIHHQALGHHSLHKKFIALLGELYEQGIYHF